MSKTPLSLPETTSAVAGAPPYEQLELPGIMPNEVQGEPPRWLKLSQYAWQIATFGNRALTSNKAIGAALIFAPEMAAALALYYGPAAEVDNLPIQGTHIVADLRPGHDSIDAQLTLADLRVPQHKTIFGKPVGATLHGSISSILNDSFSTLNAAQIKNLSAVLGQADNEIAKIQSKVTLHSEYTAALAAGAMIELEALGFMGRTIYRRCLARRSPGAQSEITDFIRPITTAGRAALAYSLTTGIVASGTLLSPLSNVHDQLTPSPSLNNTFLAGSQLTTPENSQVEPLIQQGIRVITNERKVYGKIDKNQATALQAAFSNLAELHKKYIFVTEADDFQGVAGTLNTFAKASKQVGADLVVVNGDIGTDLAPYDQLLVKNFVDGVGDTPVAVAGGEHDSRSLMAYMKSLGILVPEGSTVQTVAGLKLLLLPSLELSQLGIGGEPLAATPGLSHTKLLEETVKNTITQLAQQHVNLVVVHDSAEGEPIAESGLADSLFEGRSFAEQDFKIIKHNENYTFKLKNSSTGGHGSGDGPEFTVIHNPARYSIVLYDKQTQKPAMVYLVTIQPDTSVSIDSPLIIGDDSQLNFASPPKR